jgi:hypothetical protein
MNACGTYSYICRVKFQITSLFTTECVRGGQFFWQVTHPEELNLSSRQYDATGWTVWGSNPVGGEIFRARSSVTRLQQRDFCCGHLMCGFIGSYRRFEVPCCLRRRS